MTRRKHLSVLAAFGLCCAMAYPQGHVSHIAFRVVDEANAPIPNAQVSISAMSNGSTLQGAAATDQNGVIRFALPKADSYVISISAPSFNTSQTNFDYPLSPAMTFTLTRANTGATAAPATSGTSEATSTASPALDAAPATSTPQANEKPLGIGGIILLVLVALLIAFAPLLSFFAVREIAVRVVSAFMMRKAPKTPTAPVPATAPEAAHASLTDDPISNGDRAELSFLELNSTNGVILNGPAQDRLERCLRTAGRRMRAFVWFLWIQVLIAVLVVIPYAFKFHLHAFPELRAGAIPGAILVGAFAVVAFFFTVFAINSWITSERLGTVIVVLSVLIQTAIAIVIWRAVQLPLYVSLPPIVAGVAFLVLANRRIERPTRIDGNRRLLILRVFGSDKNAAYTFGKLMRKWRFVGSFSTIVDPSYLRYQFSAFSPANSRQSVGIALWYALAAGLLYAAGHWLQGIYPWLFPARWTAIPSAQQDQYLRTAAYLLLIPLSFLPILWYVRRRFTVNSLRLDALIDGTMQSSRPPGLGGIFRGLAMFCFDDVWRPAVGHLLERADVVLMDLRGFRPERKGCAYEIGELMNHFPVGKLLFLVDEKCDKQELYQLVRKRWLSMSHDSPNYSVEEPFLKIYQAHKRRKADLPRILSLLSACVDDVAKARERHLVHWV